MSGPSTPRYDQKQLDDLFLRAKTVLGSDQIRLIRSSKPRSSAFSTAIKLAIKAIGSPDKVTDEQLLGALEIALETWPVEAEIITDAMLNKVAR